ncbi:MAG TPA: thiosulfate oxidation carrier protein SoxY [Methylomirabilota bacterium]|nr:thiosulfate oxidation carrier protein SoxY [Methylomirabilota bacterium]
METWKVGRRQALKVLGAAAVAFGGPALLVRGAVAQQQAMAWNKDAFAAQSVADVLKALGAGSPAATQDVSWGATPAIAENGAVVPVNVTSKIPDTESIAIIIEKNPNKLAGNFFFPEGTEPALATRVKMSESSNVHAVVRTKSGKAFMATREIKVTLGGCGG